MNNSVAIGIVGTAKNTGKTTTLSHLLDHAKQYDLTYAVTGIGYDGEEIDNITMLPKPRLHLHNGTILTTSEVCLKRSPVEYRIISRTGISTALGELLIIEIIKGGMVVVAGPNKVATLRTVLDAMRENRSRLIFVDGSINRMMPMSIVDRIIFATGAARNVDIPFLVEEMKTIEFLFNLPVTEIKREEENVSVVRNDGSVRRMSLRSVIDEEDVKAVRSHMADGHNRICIPGIISKDALRHLRNSGIGATGDIEIVLPSPLTLLLHENTTEIVSIVDSLAGARMRISYVRKPRFLGVTVNPFYPLYEAEHFSNAYIDKHLLMEEMRRNLAVPVFNVLDEHTRDRLFKLCIA
jgi:hypothetical protein